MTMSSVMFIEEKSIPKSRRAAVAETTIKSFADDSDVDMEMSDGPEPGNVYLYDLPRDEEFVCSDEEVREACDGLVPMMR